MAMAHAELEYKELTDSKQAQSDVERLESINKATEKLVEDLGKCCCLHCEQCLHALSACATVVGEQIVRGAQGTNTALISPVLRSVDSVLRGPKRNDIFELPKDVALFVFNPVITLSEIFAKANGDFTFIPFQPAIARAIDCVDLLGAVRRSELSAAERAQRTVAAVTALTFATYASLYTLVLVDMINNEDQRNLQSLLPLPQQMVESLKFATWNALQWSVASVGGYVMVTNAYIFGKELVLDKITNAYRNIEVRVKADAIQRHLEQLDQVPLLVDKQLLHSEFQKKLAENKGLWFTTDVIGRTLEQTLTTAMTTVTRLARDTAANLTSYKSVIKKLKSATKYASDAVAHHLPPALNPAVAPVAVAADANPRSRFNLSGCYSQTTKAILDCCFAEPDLEAGDAPPSYQDVLNEKKSSYYRASPATLIHTGFYAAASAKDLRLQSEIIASYKKAVIAFNQKDQSLDIPFGMTGEPSNPNWQQDALKDEKIQALLRGEIERADVPFDKSSPFEIAYHYNESLHRHYRGMPVVEASAPSLPSPRSA